jgi:hypothetical protein
MRHQTLRNPARLQQQFRTMTCSVHTEQADEIYANSDLPYSKSD